MTSQTSQTGKTVAEDKSAGQPAKEGQLPQLPDLGGFPDFTPETTCKPHV